MAGRTDALVDHGDACLTLATVLAAAGDTAGARVAADKAVELYELKGAAALAEKARGIVGAEPPAAPAAPELPRVGLDNACVQVGERVTDAVNREAWEEFERLFAPVVLAESRRTIVGRALADIRSDDWAREQRRYLEAGGVRLSQVVIAVRGERLALARMMVGSADASAGAPQDEFLQIYGIDDAGRIALQVWFDNDDIDSAIGELDAAHARFQEQQPRAPLENAASRGIDRYVALFAEGRWDEIGMLLAEDVRIDDRRQGLRGESNGRAAAVAEARTIAALGVNRIISKPVALRGDRLCLSYLSVEASDNPVDAFHFDALSLVEMDTDGLFVGRTNFDPEDLDAAIEELDARYVAGEAAPHAHTWSVIAKGYAAFNRRELLATTPEWESVDHRRGAGFAPGEMIAYLKAAWADSPDTKIYIAAVHRLSDLGGVVTHVAHGISQEGFDAEWRDIHVLTVDGEMVSRSELFDEASLDAALARFEELRPHARRLENTASRTYERLQECYAARDWDAISDMVADDVSNDDRRRVVNAGLQHGRDAVIAEISAIADVGITNWTWETVATRGERLVLNRARASQGERPEAFRTDVLDIVETDADGQLVTRVVFDPDDIDAAFEELDARYLAGEADAYRNTWSVIAQAYASISRHEPPPLTPDCVNIDHRRTAAAIAPGDLIAYIRSGRELGDVVRPRMEVVHRLTNRGAVITYAAHGTSPTGFEAEWREISFSVVDGDLINRVEIFDETDLDAALARFEELSRPALRLENAASQVWERLNANFSSGDWAAMSQVVAQNMLDDDRRRTVNGGVRRGRDIQIANGQAVAETGADKMTSTVIAIRGERLALCRSSFFVRDQQPETFRIEFLSVIEIDVDEQLVAHVAFDLDDIDAAFVELDSRYLAGEAAAYAHTWSVMSGAFVALNRREVPPTTTDWVNIDHRRAIAFAHGQAIPNLRAWWDLAGGTKVYIARVHQLSHVGAIFNWAAYGTSEQGFDAEWRGTNILTFDGSKISRCELFDEVDIEAALARFDEISRPVPQLENAASRVADRLRTSFAARDWYAIAELLADNMSSEDRRRVVGGGLRNGRDEEIANMRAMADLEATHIESTALATRGAHLVLHRLRVSDDNERSEGSLLSIIEVDADSRVVGHVAFDLDDVDAAFAELDSRYSAGEAATYAQTWSVIAESYAAIRRHELPPITPDCVTIDHRCAVSFEPGDLIAYIRSGRELGDEFQPRIEVVHRLTNRGAVITYAARGTSSDGFEAEWREISLSMVDGDLVDRCEIFDETDLDAALARFDELSRPAPQPANAASRVYARMWTCFAARDWAAMAELFAADLVGDDRRRVVNAGIRRGRDAGIADMRAIAEVVTDEITWTAIAARGERLILCRPHSPTFQSEVLNIAEIDADERIRAVVVFDPDDIDVAFAELDSRYAAGEAAAHAHTWSVIAQGFDAVNRREIPATTSDFIDIDHRQVAGIGSGDLRAYLSAAFDDLVDNRLYVESVHRLTGLGAVVTHVAKGTSQDGLDVEWRLIDALTIDGDLINRCEMFDETDLDVALARFDELSRPTPRLENAANQVAQRFLEHFAARDFGAIADLFADGYSLDDRRRTVNAGVRRGRDSAIARHSVSGRCRAVGESVVGRYCDPGAPAWSHVSSRLGPRPGGEPTRCRTGRRDRHRRTVRGGRRI